MKKQATEEINGISRRNFLTNTAFVAAGLAFEPLSFAGYLEKQPKKK